MITANEAREITLLTSDIVKQAMNSLEYYIKKQAEAGQCYLDIFSDVYGPQYIWQGVMEKTNEWYQAVNLLENLGYEVTRESKNPCNNINDWFTRIRWS
jgi:hypothetical protein